MKRSNKKLFCSCCPRKCLTQSFCGKTKGKLRIAKVMRHTYEEPIICPENKGSGGVFFSFCSLKCVFCQNYELSSFGIGQDMEVSDFAHLLNRLDKEQVANINLVTPTHYVDEIIEALKIYRPKKPVIWNTSGYELKENILRLKGLVDIFLFDAKYFSEELSLKYSKVKGYFKNFISSLKVAREIIGEDIVINGEMKRGIIIRHLVLPRDSQDSIKIFSEIKNAIGTDVYISLMCQYVPMFNAKNYKEINRRLTPLEYKKVVKEVTNRLGFNKGFVQEPSSADACYTPDFSPDKFFEL